MVMVQQHTPQLQQVPQLQQAFVSAPAQPLAQASIATFVPQPMGVQYARGAQYVAQPVPQQSRSTHPSGTVYNVQPNAAPTAAEQRLASFTMASTISQPAQAEE